MPGYAGMKEIPSTMFIEMALDLLRVEKPDAILRELSEFRGVGANYVHKLTESIVKAASPDDTYPPVTELEIGYLLGVETARAMLATLPPAVAAGVQI